MAFSSGTFSLIAGNPVVTGTTVSSTWANNTLTDIATNGLSICLLKDGTQTVTGNITLSGFNLLACPVHIGGTAAGSSLELRSTSGAGATTDYIKFTVGNNGGTEAARIIDSATSQGQALLLGTTTAFAGEQFASSRTSNNPNVYINNNSATHTTYMMVLNETGIAGSTSWKLIEGDNSGGVCLNIFGNGNITNTNNSYGAICDEKIKNRIGFAGSQWEDVKALGRLVTKFTLKADKEAKPQIGWIAQDVQKVSPGLVFATPDYAMRQVVVNGVPQFHKKEVKEGGVTREVDDLDKPVLEQYDLGTVTLGVHYSVGYMKAVKALGENMERTESLETTVGGLVKSLGDALESIEKLKEKLATQEQK